MGDYSSGREENWQGGAKQVTGTWSHALCWGGLLSSLGEGDEASVPWKAFQPKCMLPVPVCAWNSYAMGSPQIPSAPQNPVHALGSDCHVIAGATYGSSSDEDYTNTEQYMRHCISIEIPSKTLAIRAPLGVHRLHGEARQLALPVPGGPPYIAAAMREVTLPSLALHSLSPPFFLYFPPCLAFLTT